MAKYKGKFVMGGVETGQVMDQLQTGDELSLISAFGKVIKLTIQNTYRYDGRRVYETDRLGLIYADEVQSVSMPAWNKATLSRRAKVV
ncbi:hypothetical protein [Paludifilum halophilum]|uniref:Uncharacterized protein n=1 Tax=Paludifilum halophilum TaxID=1642702 RepID=A0A235B5P8_9BACL|nr:hypothetical protein [Paludifilum halophilum]OYD07628.1 hypothetical protein CHM34_09100 [Paludifilum halophilum]